MGEQVQPIRLVIFDIAGTIIEDHGEVLASVSQALEKNGIAAEEGELREWKGASKREAIRHFVEPHGAKAGRPAAERVERVYRDFREALEAQYDHNLVPIKGAESTFAWLLERGIQIAATTGFYREITDLILRKTGWEKLLANNVCSTDVAMGRPAPFMIFRAMENARVADVEQVINVGDTPMDLQAGARANVEGVIGVLTGAHTEQRLRREPHTHIIASVAELPAVLEADFGVP